MQLARKVEIAAPPALVWALIDDPANLPRWMPDIVATHFDAGEEPRRVGARFTQTIREGGRIKSYDGAVTAYEPRQRLSIRLSDPSFTVDVDYRIAGVGGGSRLDYACAAEVTGWLARIMMPLGRIMLGRILDRHLASLKRIAEEDARRGTAPA